MVIALTAASSGRYDGSRFPRSMTTDVSRIPRGGRRMSATRRRVLACGSIELGTEPLVVVARRGAAHGHGGLCRDEAMTSERRQLADRDTVARDDEGVAFVELSHDFAAVVA